MKSYEAVRDLVMLRGSEVPSEVFLYVVFAMVVSFYAIELSYLIVHAVLNVSFLRKDRVGRKSLNLFRRAYRGRDYAIMGRSALLVTLVAGAISLANNSLHASGLQVVVGLMLAGWFLFAMVCRFNTEWTHFIRTLEYATGLTKFVYEGPSNPLTDPSFPENYTIAVYPASESEDDAGE